MAQRTISEARELIAKVWGEDPAAGIANAVLDHLEAERPEEITFGEVMSLGGREGLDDDVTRALAMLAGSPAAVLDSRFRFEEENGDLIPSPSRTLFDDSPYFHPVTGEEVADWEDRVKVDFTVREGIYDNAPTP